jgi:enoyl-CoA hydratase
MSQETILLERDGPVLVLRLNRPERMNAVIERMYVEIHEALASAAADPAVRVLVLTGSVLHRDGAVRQAFCAGADLKEHADGHRDAAARRAYIELAHETTRRLWSHPTPVIAALNGPARGAGAEMAVACDLILMADSATLAFPETGLGTFVGGGVTLHLPRLVGLARAKELIYTGRVLDGPAAVEIGLAVASMPVERLMDQALDLARRLAERAPLSMTLAKRHLQRGYGLELDAVLRQETDAILACMATADWQEGVRAFAERRRPVFQGS